MWTLKMRIYNKKNFFNRIAHKYNLTMYGYPLNSFKENNNFYVTVAGKMVGPDKTKRIFLKQLTKVKEIRYMDIKDDFGILCVKQPIQIEKLYSPNLIYLEPIKTTKDFCQVYHIASWDRKKLSALLQMKVPNVKVKVLQFKQKKIGDISVTSISPELTKKQEEAFKIAYKNGYYNFPRNAGLVSLSKMMKISLSTYQAHLRKAERKIMDFFYKYLE